jgi:predicted transcriptional regulator
MKLQKIVEELDLKIMTRMEDKDVQGVFISDLLSDVMTSANAGDLWLTVQTHHNIIAVANLVNTAAVVVTHGKKIPEETLSLGQRYHVVILSTPHSIFDLAAKLNALGLKAK